MTIKTPRTLFISRIAILSAFSVAGSFIHPPSPIQTVAFDSAPGFFAGLFFGPIDGAFVCGIGHIATSLVNDFPLGLVHLPIAFGMALAGWAIGAVNNLLRKRWAFIPALILGVGINAALFVIVIPISGWAAAFAFMPFLIVAACLNAAVAASLYIAFRARKLRL